MTRAFVLCLFTIAALAGGCGGGSTGVTDGMSGAADLGISPDLSSGACNRKVPCTDTQIQDQALFKKASTRKIENTQEGAGWASRVDSSAGGMTPRESFVYAKFTDMGLVRVDVGDEAAFDSTEWDLAFRRFIIRLNSGVSGPSCVAGAAAAGAYDDLKTVPANLDPLEEDYYTDSCDLLPDGSGLPGIPATRLGGFWKYEGCVQMTGQLYVIRLADGRHLKFAVTSYYAPADQMTCDQTGMPGGATSGDVHLRWSLIGK